MDESALWELLRAQHGVATVYQATAMGVTRSRLRTLIQKKVLEVEGRGLFSLNGAPRSWEYQAIIGVLLAGPRRPADGIRSALCDTTAATMLDLVDPIEGDAIHVLSTRRVANREGYEFHWSSRLLEEEIIRLDDLPVIDPIRAFIDLCASQAHRAFSIYRRGLRRKVFTREEIADRIERESRQGRSGLRRARQVLELTDPTSDRARSSLEDHYFRLLVEAGLPKPERNVTVRGADRTWEIDMYFRSQRFGLEVSPSWWHGDPWVLTKDARKTWDLNRVGVRLLVITELMPDDEVIDQVKGGLADAVFFAE